MDLKLAIKQALVKMLEKDSRGLTEFDKLIRYYRDDKHNLKLDKQFAETIAQVQDLSKVSIVVVINSIRSVHTLQTIYFIASGLLEESKDVQ